MAEARSEGRPTPFTVQAMTNPKGFAGVLGIFRFTADQQNERALAVFTVDSGEARQIDPAPRRFPRGGV